MGAEKALPQQKHHNMFLDKTAQVIPKLDQLIMTFGRKLTVNDTQMHNFFNLEEGPVSLLLAYNEYTKPENNTHFEMHSAQGVWSVNFYENGISFLI